ncbi:MAG: CRISPR-associated RAMP protein [Nitrospinae bacterium]|nr:CRISPR-associated RAMP protein [Nitrospinota bacterium]
MFGVLKNRYVIQGNIVFKTPLHIGSGESGTRTDSLVVKYFNGEPYIPGSSFKGVLRGTLERIAPVLGLDSCLLYSGSECGKVIREEIEGNSDLKKMVENLPDGEEVYMKYLLEEARKNRGLCRTCRLFGSPYMASRIYFDDLQADNSVGNLRYEVRDGVGIDRDTGTAVEGVKYDYEVVPQGIKFSLRARMENAEDEDILLLAVGLRELTEGIRMGGMTSRGLGSCKIEGLEITEFLLETEEGKKKFWAYLATGKLPPGAIKGETFIKERILAAFPETGEKEAKPC